MLLAPFILIAVGCAVREHWGRLGRYARAWDWLLLKWFLQGVVAPSVLWALLNLGISRRLPAPIPDIAFAQAHDNDWGSLWITAVITGAAFVALNWAAITYAWMFALIFRESGQTPEFRKTCVTVGLPLLFLAFVISFHAAWTVLPIALITVLLPIVHFSLSGVERIAPVPSYSQAQGQINFGKYKDAELEVISQLEKSEHDFQGWLMLAEIYATKYQRFDDAAQVVVDLCNDPAVQPVEVSVACHKLADWQLNLAQNPAAARAALDLLCQRLPGTHFAHMAKTRLKQLPRTQEDLLEQKKPRPIRLPSLREDFSADSPSQPVSKREATLEANRLTDRLKDLPNDFVTRERLAIVLAEKLGHVNLGIEQLRLIVSMLDVAAEARAKCLAQIANWERRLNKNEQKFQTVLNEIVREFPNTTQAMAARRQLQLLEYEALEKTNPSSETPEISAIRLKVPKS